MRALSSLEMSAVSGGGLDDGDTVTVTGPRDRNPYLDQNWSSFGISWDVMQDMLTNVSMLGPDSPEIDELLEEMMRALAAERGAIAAAIEGLLEDIAILERLLSNHMGPGAEGAVYGYNWALQLENKQAELGPLQARLAQIDARMDALITERNNAYR